MKSRNKTGGGPGSNQYGARGQGKDKALSDSISRRLESSITAMRNAGKSPYKTIMPWTGEARKIWVQIMRKQVRRHVGDRRAALDASPQRWHSVYGVLSERFGDPSPEFKHENVQERNQERDQSNILDMALTVAPEAFQGHMGLLAPEWPLRSDAANRIVDLSHPNYPTEVLDRLADDPIPEVRQAVAEHPNCSPLALVKLQTDTVRAVRKAAFRNPRTPEHIRLIGTLGDP